MAPLKRIGILLRAHSSSEAMVEKKVFGDYEFDPGSKRVFVRDNSVTLRHKEFELALLLFKHMSLPLSRSQILDAIWRQGLGILSRSLDTHVSMVRTKLSLRPENGYLLRPVYGYGYGLERIDKDES